MRPRLSNGEFKEKFDPLDTHGQGFIEGNAWNYSLYVPHHPKKLIELMGGEERFVSRLDSLFSMELPDKYFEKTEDISREGIIGNYVHGNEPSHHVLYLYNWTHQAFKSHDKIRKVLTEMYKSTPDGLGGNDDFGQMSAWYIFSSLGFYPVAPGSTTYAIGSPSIEVAQIQLANEKTFVIETKNQSAQNVFVSHIEHDGIPLKKPFITHEDILKGGTLTFYMSDKPNPNYMNFN